MSPVQLTGLVSGIDTRSIVDQIIAARTQPIFRFEDRITEQEARRTALDDLRGRISTLMTRVKNLASISRLNSRTALVTKTATNDTKGASIAVDSTAAIGSFTISVEQLATATQVESTGAIGQSIDAAVTLDLAGFGTTPVMGTFTIAGNASATITIDAADTLTTVIAKINAETGTTGITLTDVSGNFLAATGMLAATQTVGLNAAYKIDGGATQYSSSNIVSDALPGVTLTLLAAEAGDNATVTISSNDDKVVTDIQDFVEQYNSVTDFIRELTLTNPDGESGVLSRDSGIRLLGQSLRSTVVGLGRNLTTQFTSLSDVGITFGTVGSDLGETNLLKVNEADLREAIKDDRNAVVQLFAAVEVSASFSDGAGSLASATGRPDRQQAGTYTITDDGAGTLTLKFVPADGSTTINSTGSITAGGTNETLIPGMTLTAGDDTITVTRSKAGIAVTLRDSLDAQLRKDGSFDTKNDTIDERIKDLNDRIDRLEERLKKEQIRLERKFAIMEQAFARFQTQRAFLEGLSSLSISKSK